MDARQRVQQLQQELWVVDDSINAELEKYRDCNEEVLQPSKARQEELRAQVLAAKAELQRSRVSPQVCSPPKDGRAQLLQSQVCLVICRRCTKLRPCGAAQFRQRKHKRLWRWRS